MAFLTFAAVFLCAQVAGLHIMDAVFPIPIYLVMVLIPDFVIGICAFRFLLSFQKPRFMAFLVCAFAVATMVVASSLKFSVLGQSVLFGDLYLISELLVASSLVEQVLIFAIAAGLLLLFLVNFRLGTPPFAPAMLLTVFFGSAIVAQFNSAASTILVQIAPFRATTLPFYGHFINAWAQFVEATQHEHRMNGPREEVPFDLIIDTPAGIIDTRRNIYVILLESFIDPAWFPGFSWSREPLTELFARWRSEVGSVAISPVFGNGSTNAEFEIMCGLPAAVGGSSIVFQYVREGARLPCLPDFLARHGYRTFSIVAEPPSFLHSGTARRGMGFQRTIFAPEMDMTDRDGGWLSAEAMFQQALAFNEQMRTRGGEAPIFSLVFVTAGHFPYERDMTARPDVITMQPDDAIVRAWVNGAHYNAVAATRYIEAIQQSDPTALIILAGDHNPALGANFAGYRRGGRVPPGQESTPLRSRALYETPLLILDGPRLVDVGRLPAWQIPEIVIDILSEGKYCASRNCASSREVYIRPFFDFLLLLSPRDEESPVCELRGAPEGQHRDSRCAEAVREARALQQALARMLTGKQ